MKIEWFALCLGFCCSLMCLSEAALPGLGSIKFVDKTYRIYSGGRGGAAEWRDGLDRLKARGFEMVNVQAGLLDKPATAISTPYGTLGISSQTPLFKKDFHISYGIPTPWPYCKALTECLVYSQIKEPAYGVPIMLQLPTGVKAIDFYLDAGIDCVKTLKAKVSCTIRLEPGGVDVSGSLWSICDSAFVGKYFGFYTVGDEDLGSVSIRCQSSYPNVLGLLRIGSRKQGPTSSVGARRSTHWQMA